MLQHLQAGSTLTAACLQLTTWAKSCRNERQFRGSGNACAEGLGAACRPMLLRRSAVNRRAALPQRRLQHCTLRVLASLSPPDAGATILPCSQCCLACECLPTCCWAGKLRWSLAGCCCATCTTGEAGGDNGSVFGSMGSSMSSDSPSVLPWLLPDRLDSATFTLAPQLGRLHAVKTATCSCL